jgi:D-alanyl-D-alanine carboxypeptidase
MNKFFISCVLGIALTHAPVFAKSSQAEDFHSNIAYVVDVDSGEVLVDRNSSAISPIASISK